MIRRAVSGMLPKNRLRDDRLNRLLIFPEQDHPYAQNILKAHRERGMHAANVDTKDEKSVLLS